MNTSPKIHTIRNEIAKRLNVYRKTYKKYPDSFNATLGIGRLPKINDRPFTGWGIDEKRYINGYQV